MCTYPIHNDLEFYVRGLEYTPDLTRSTTEIAAATLQRIEARIQRGYKEWIANPLRARSGEVDSGCWWTLHGDPKEFPHWRVSWIEVTGELYACSKRDDQYILLATTQPKDKARSEFYLEGWGDFDSPIHNNLTALLEQIQARTSEPMPQTFFDLKAIALRIASAILGKNDFLDLPDGQGGIERVCASDLAAIVATELAQTQSESLAEINTKARQARDACPHGFDFELCGICTNDGEFD